MSEMKKTKVVCMGIRMVGEKKRMAFRALGEREGSLFGVTKRSRRYAPGAIYELEAALGEDGTIETARFADHFASYVGTHDNKDEVAAWRIAHDAAVAEDRARREYQADNGPKAALAVLNPLREIYRTTDAVGRRALEATVLGYLRASSR